MKKFFVLFLIFFSNFAHAQWVPIDTLSSLGSDCNGWPLSWNIIFADSSTAYLYYSRDACSPTNSSFFHIDKTDDSFKSYTYLEGCGGGIWPGCSLQDIDVISSDTVYFIYSYVPGPHLMKTTNGGTTWTELLNKHLCNMYFINGHLGYGFYGDSLFMLYNDSWYFVNRLLNFPIYNNLYFFDSLKGCALVYSHLTSKLDSILQTSDGGLTWAKVYIDSSKTFLPYLKILNDSVALINEYSEYIYKTRDAGLHWEKILHHEPYVNVNFLNEQQVYFVNKDIDNDVYYYFSNDMGATWASVKLPDGISSGYATMLNDSVGFIEAYSQTLPNKQIIMKTTNNGNITKAIILNPPFYQIFVFPNPNHGSFQITVPDELMFNIHIKLEIYNNIGKLVLSAKINMPRHFLEINLDNEAKGIYHIELKSGSKRYNGMVIIE